MSDSDIDTTLKHAPAHENALHICGRVQERKINNENADQINFDFEYVYANNSVWLLSQTSIDTDIQFPYAENRWLALTHILIKGGLVWLDGRL